MKSLGLGKKVGRSFSSLITSAEEDSDCVCSLAVCASLCFVCRQYVESFVDSES